MALSNANGSFGADGKVEVERVESQQVQKRSFRQKVKHHYTRWWWTHILALIAVFLLIFLPVIYVAMPKVAQKGVDESTMDFVGLSFLAPSPESLTLTVQAVQHQSSIFTPTIDLFNVSMYLVTDGTTGSQPITQIGLPQIHSHYPDTDIDIENQLVPILDFDQVTAFTIAVLNQENVTVRMVGNTKLHEGKLPVCNINYNSSVTFQGLNGLPGFNITNTKVSQVVPAGQPNMFGDVAIPNPSVLTMELGNVTMDIFTAKFGIVGHSTVNDFTLKPGMNTLPMHATVNSSLVLEDIGPEGIVDLMIVGQTAVYNRQHLTYYEKALQSHTFHLSLNITAILQESV